MPDTTAHHYFGQQVFKALPADVQALLSAHKSVFDLGLQGPDLLFYYKPFLNNQIRELGVQIHWHSARGRMAAAAARLRERADDAALCYLLGYACHHALDSAFHGDIARLASSQPIMRRTLWHSGAGSWCAWKRRIAAGCGSSIRS